MGEDLDEHKQSYDKIMEECERIEDSNKFMFMMLLDKYTHRRVSYRAIYVTLNRVVLSFH